MTDAGANGKTLWEMLRDRWRSTQPIAIDNPLQLAIAATVFVPRENGPELDGFDFSVKQLREYIRHIAGQEFGFTDYVLGGINTKTFDANDAVTIRLRVVPNQAGGHDTLLLQLYDEFGFDEAFLDVLKDPSGIFNATDDQKQATESYTRLNQLRDPYEAGVLVVTSLTSAGQAVPANTKTVKLQYWDYGRDVDLGAGKTGQRFFFVEQNTDTGWFQLWRAREFFPDTTGN